VCGILLLSSCATEEEVHGIVDGRLAPCPDTPNCVSSDAGDDSHRVAPLVLEATPEAGWSVLQEVLATEKRTTVVTVNETYLHAEVRSAVFRFVDDIEFHLRPAEGLIAVRSASRVGRSDFGVNRDRVESIRARLRSRGVVE
jgi:uncharacterized protein (DUF1499 family)